MGVVIWRAKLVREAFAYYGMTVSNYAIARHCNNLVSAHYVGTIRKKIAAEQGVQPSASRTVRRGNSTYTMNTQRIGTKRRRVKKTSSAIDKRIADVFRADYGREI